jgi:hypothetical protein
MEEVYGWREKRKKRLRKRRRRIVKKKEDKKNGRIMWRMGKRMRK